MSPGYSIVNIGQPDSPAGQASEIAGMHASLLSHSPLVLMGPQFMEDFYYSILPAEGLIRGAVAYVDGEAAGFIICTDNPEGFMSEAVRRHRISLAWILFRSVLASPRRLLAINEARSIQGNVQAEKFGPDVGELLSFGVLPAYRSRSFARQRGLQVGADLLQRAVELLAAAGKTRVRAIVDKDNLEAQFFYRGQGFRVGIADVKGWNVPTMEFIRDIESTSSPTRDAAKHVLT